MKRVLFVDHTPFAGGGQLVLVEHIAALDKDEFDPHVACTDAVPELVEAFAQAGSIVHILDMPRLKGGGLTSFWAVLKASRQLRAIIAMQHIQLVIANTTRASYITSLAVFGTKIPSIWWVRDFLYPKRIFRLLQSLPVRIFCVSKALANFYIPDSPKVDVLYVASDIYKQLPAISDLQQQQELSKYGFSAQQTIVGFMGRLVSEKGAQDVIEAVAMLLPKYPHLRLLIVGTGKGQQHDIEMLLHQLVKEQGLGASVQFAGYQTNQALYYSLFDLFIMSTRDTEGFATSVVQAMMAGSLVIGTRVGGTPELVIDGQTGLLYEPGNAKQLAELIAGSLDNPNQTTFLAKAGQQRVLQYHTEEQLARQAEAIYRAVIEPLP